MEISATQPGLLLNLTVILTSYVEKQKSTWTLTQIAAIVPNFGLCSTLLQARRTSTTQPGHVSKLLKPSLG
jgi:hypothetical protein